MKRKLLTFMLVGVIGGAFAQKANRGVLGKAKTFASFIDDVENPSNQLESERPVVSLKTNLNKSFEAVVNLKRSYNGISEIVGNSKSDPKSTFFLEKGADGNVSGMYISVKERVVYVYSTDKNTGMLVANKEDINKHICIDYDAAPWAKVDSDKDYPFTSDRPQPKLSSLPGAKAVIYLDFDGEVVTSNVWNSGKTINAKSYNYSDKEIEDQWEIVAEDFRPYDVNVTTDRDIYDNAPKSSRMMCIVTPTDDAAPGSGGVAYIGSFSNGKDDPCWTFNKGNKTGGETCSHEVGHTVSLQHDGKTGGTVYYQGHGDWAPIMGASYERPIGHWSKGEYPDANQKQDDLSTIATKHFPFLSDDVGNTMGLAKSLMVDAGGQVSGDKNKGIIGMNDDIDMFKINASSSADLDLKIEPFYRYPNLNIKARLLDNEGKELLVSDPTGDDKMYAEIKMKLDPGTYYLEIDGVGEGNTTTGYSDYNSMGGFSISGIAPQSNVSIDFEDELVNDLTISPNPASNNINIKFNTSNKESYKVELTNALGEVVFEKSLTNFVGQFNQDIDLTNFSEGVYLFNITNAKRTISRKIIKN